MIHPILSRTWEKSTKTMIYDSGIPPTDQNDDDLVRMISVGRTNKNGDQIFIGDLFKYVTKKGIENFYEVVFVPKNCAIRLLCLHGTEEDAIRNPWRHDEIMNYEPIGNACENLDLIPK